MKKFIAIILVLLLAVSLGACGEDKPNPQPDDRTAYETFMKSLCGKGFECLFHLDNVFASEAKLQELNRYEGDRLWFDVLDIAWSLDKDQNHIVEYENGDFYYDKIDLSWLQAQLDDLYGKGVVNTQNWLPYFEDFNTYQFPEEFDYDLMKDLYDGTYIYYYARGIGGIFEDIFISDPVVTSVESDRATAEIKYVEIDIDAIDWDADSQLSFSDFCEKYNLSKSIQIYTVHLYKDAEGVHIKYGQRADSPDPGPQQPEPCGYAAVITSDGINIRKAPDSKSERVGFAKYKSRYEVTEIKDAGGYTWYCVGADQWIASDGSWVYFSTNEKDLDDYLAGRADYDAFLKKLFKNGIASSPEFGVVFASKNTLESLRKCSCDDVMALARQFGPQGETFGYDDATASTKLERALLQKYLDELFGKRSVDTDKWLDILTDYSSYTPPESADDYDNMRDLYDGKYVYFYSRAKGTPWNDIFVSNPEILSVDGSTAEAQIRYVVLDSFYDDDDPDGKLSFEDFCKKHELTKAVHTVKIHLFKDDTGVHIKYADWK